MKRWVKPAAIFGAVVGAIALTGLVSLLASQTYFASLDRAANEAFGAKAQQNHIEGMSEDAVRRIFGPPAYTYRQEDFRSGEPYHVLVYTPGPRLALWNSECKINVDDATGRVRGWMINSD